MANNKSNFKGTLPKQQGNDLRKHNKGAASDKQFSNNGNDKKKRLPVPDIDKIIPEYRTKEYRNNNNEYALEFIVEYPVKIAEILTDRKKYFIDSKENNNTQIRRYYEVVRKVETELQLGHISLNEALLEINRLRGHVANARSGGKVSKVFVEFININLEKIKVQDDLVFFAKHFEAVIGFSKKEQEGR